MAKTKSGQELPDLSNATITYLIDEVGEVRAQIKKLEELKGWYEAGLQTKEARHIRDMASLPENQRTPIPTRGEHYAMDKSSFERTALDKAKVEAKLSAEDFAECFTTTTVTQRRFTKLEG